MKKLNESFFQKDVLEVAPKLLGKFITVVKNNEIIQYMITEVEAYKGEEDKACHAHKGRTKRTEIMYHSGGHIYVYLIYGMYWMLNVVTGATEDPQAILIRGIVDFPGPGKLSRLLGINKTYYGENICRSDRIWIEDKGIEPDFYSTPRVGIDYAGNPWSTIPWRYVCKRIRAYSVNM